jgi:MoaA/NifB/PqqE/SkfB family radical SAM enzyme
MIAEAIRRYRALRTHRIYSLPIAILMPHSQCNCRCVMCDIWKDNRNPAQFDEERFRSLIVALRRLHTRSVVLSGGEALLHPRVFDFCEMLRDADLHVTILSTGLLLRRHARDIVRTTHELIVSLDGPKDIHDRIRRIPGAFEQLAAGVSSLKELNGGFPIAGRCVVQKENIGELDATVESARSMGLDRISFLAVDVHSSAFNRPSGPIDGGKALLPDLVEVSRWLEDVREMATSKRGYFGAGFISESPEKLERIGEYFRACHRMRPFEAPKCRAPWVSAVVEANGVVRPCFFHQAYGHLDDLPLDRTINSEKAVAFRRNLKVAEHETCRQCVCWLNLGPLAKAP